MERGGDVELPAMSWEGEGEGEALDLIASGFTAHPAPTGEQTSGAGSLSRGGAGGTGGGSAGGLREEAR